MDFDFAIITGALPYLWKGFLYTVELTAIAAVPVIFVLLLWVTLP